MPKSNTLRMIRDELLARNVPGDVAFIATTQPGWYLIQHNNWGCRQRLGMTSKEALAFVRRFEWNTVCK